MGNDPVTGPSASYLFDRDAGTLTKLYVTRPELEGAPLQPMHPVEITSRDGLTLPSYLTLPPGSDSDADGVPDAPVPMVLLVQNEQGYLNLTQLVSQMYTAGDRTGEPRLSREDLEGKTDGLIALSGAQYGDIGQALLADDTERAASCLSDWLRLFPDRFYIELQRVGKSEEEAYIERVLSLAVAYRAPVVATNDVRFIDSSDFGDNITPLFDKNEVSLPDIH